LPKLPTPPPDDHTLIVLESPNTILRNRPMQKLVTPRRRKIPVVKKLEAAAPAIRSQFGVTRIGIFGSFARGEQTKKSDVDVLVDFAEGYATLRNFVGLADRLEALFRRNVDLITVEGVDKYIRPGVEAEVIWVEG
jgi:uncharacterized protein